MKRQVISGLLISGLFGLVCVLLHSGIGSLYGKPKSADSVGLSGCRLLPAQINSIKTLFNSVDRIVLANLITVHGFLCFRYSCC